MSVYAFNQRDSCLDRLARSPLNGPGQIALNIAATLGHTRVVQALLSHTRPPRADAQPDVSAFAPLHTCVQNGHIETVKALLASLRARGGNINVATASGDTALHFATELGRLDLVNILLDAGASLNFVDQEGDTPMHLAIDFKHHKIVKALLAHRPAPNLDLQGKEQLTPLAFAAAKGDIAMVTLLLAQKPAPNQNLRNKGGASVR